VTLNRLALFVLLLMGHAQALAQPTERYYEVRFFYAGASASFTSYWLVPVSMTPWQGVGQYLCNRTASGSTDTRNPNLIEWDDPFAPGQVCQYREIPDGPLFWLPIGAYEASLRLWTAEGGSADSLRAAFSIGGVPTPTGFKVTFR
jgi:hypothetical protein